MTTVWPPAGIAWYYSDACTAIANMDCRDMMAALPPQTFSACLTDPPYGLKFMSKNWDHGVPGIPFWEALRRVLIPGAPLLAFGGTRTHHRLMGAIEDAGFELRDVLMFLCGQGWPKSHDISKAIDKAAGVVREVLGRKTYADGTHGHVQPNMHAGWERPFMNDPEWQGKMESAPATEAAKHWKGYGTALKPAYEPIILAMAPMPSTYAENAFRYGVAGLNIDGTRIPGDPVSLPPTQLSSSPQDRWPANLLLDAEAAQMLDAAVGELKSGTRNGVGRTAFFGSGPSDRTYGRFWASIRGGPSRFFWCAKATQTDRGTHTKSALPLFDVPEERVENTHPTVKPTPLLMQLLDYLLTLVTMPETNLLIDPFMGSGSGLVAAKRKGLRMVGCDTDKEACEITARRLQQEVLPLR